MNIYVAGKTQDIEKVRAIQGLVVAWDHTITYDWTEVIVRDGGDVNEVNTPHEIARGYANLDLLGVSQAQIVIAVGHPNLCGTLWECGIAAALGKSLWLVDWHLCSRSSVFENLDTVVMIQDYMDLGKRLEQCSNRYMAKLRKMSVPLKLDPEFGDLG